MLLAGNHDSGPGLTPTDAPPSYEQASSFPSSPPAYDAAVQLSSVSVPDKLNEVRKFIRPNTFLCIWTKV